MYRSWMVLLVAACGSKSAPSNPNIDRFGSGAPPKVDPMTASGSAVDLTCRAVSQDRCVTQSYRFAADYNQPTNCRWGTDNVLAFSVGAAAPNTGHGLLLQIEGFHGAGTYELDGGADLLRLGTIATKAANACTGEHVGGEVATSPKASCAGCKVTVTDPDPAAPYPKPLTVHIACPKLCSEDAYVCDGVGLTLTQPCTR